MPAKTTGPEAEEQFVGKREIIKPHCKEFVKNNIP